MREMKDSGIEWINMIPSNWKITRLQFCLTEVNEKNSPIKTKQVLSLVKDKGVLLYEDKGNQGNKAKEDLTQYKLAYPYTLIVNSMNILIGAVGISNFMGCVSPVYYVFRETNESDLRYINYIFNTREFQKELRKYSKGILEIRLRVSAFDIFKRKIPLPNKITQIKIADFLDKKCSQIGALRADIEKQIAILEEYKKSVITEAVTKGLDPNVEMKDSGIEWIGKIPKDWQLITLKYCFELKGRIGWQGLRSSEFLDDKSLPYLITGTDFNNGLINWDTCAHITFERFYQDSNIQIKENDVLITKDGTIGKISIVKNCPSYVSLNSGVFILRNNRFYEVNKKYFYYIILSSQFDKWFELSNKGGSTILHLTQEKFYNFKYSYPPLNEQKIIVSYLEKKCSQIDSIIDSKQQQLESLDNYKKSLIYEYVTGKKEVEKSESV